MPKTDYAAEEKINQRKKTIGVAAIALLVIFAVLEFLGYMSLIVMVIADLIVAFVANYLFRRISRTPL